MEAAAAIEDRSLSLSERLGPSVALAVAGAGIAVVGGALGLPPTEFAGALLLLPLGAALSLRHPAAATAALLVLTGFSGTILIETPLTPRGGVEFILLSFWVGLAWSLTRGGRERMWLWPGVLVLGLYVGLTLLAALLTDPLSIGWESFRLSTGMMATILLIAMSPWARRENTSIARAILLVAAAVGVFSLLRWLTGPTAAEEALARAALPGVPTSFELRFYGPQGSAQQLALWAATMLPVVLALLLAWHGRWRVLALFGAMALGFTLIATEVRTGAIAGASGVAFTLLLFQLSSAFPLGRRIPVSLSAAVVIGLTLVGGFALTVGQSDERVDRFLQVLSPGEDLAYSTRVERWADAWPTITEEPLGHGLGSAGTLATRDEFIPLTATNLDNSYLKVGLEQGVAVMVLYVGALALLALSLARRAIAVDDPTRAALGIGACGTLLAAMVMFYGGFYVEQLQMVSAWTLIGIGVAQFTILDRTRPEPGGLREPAPGARGERTRPVARIGRPPGRPVGGER